MKTKESSGDTFNCIMSVHNNNSVHIVCTITYIGCILIDILNIYIKHISNQLMEWKTHTNLP